MVGDIILNIKQWIKTKFCVHEYRTTYVGNEIYFRQCVKCGRIK